MTHYLLQRYTFFIIYSRKSAKMLSRDEEKDRDDLDKAYRTRIPASPICLITKNQKHYEKTNNSMCES